MNQQLKYIFETYKLWFNTTKLQLNNVKNAFQQFKTIKNPTKQELENFNLLRDELFQVNYMMMEAHLSVENLYDEYPDNIKKKIDAYDDLYLKVYTLTGEMAQYVGKIGFNLSDDFSEQIEL